MSRKKRSSQADIAQALDVSISTVSRALADSPSITEDIRRQVRDCALRIGYPIKPRQDTDSFIDIFVFVSISNFNDAPSSIYYELLNSIRDEASKFSVEIEILMIRTREPIPAEITARMGPKTGVIFLGVTPASETLEDYSRRGIAIVMANGIEENLRVDSVSPANFISGAIMARHLIAMGHRRFLYLSGPGRLTLQRRFAGFRQQVEEHAGGPSATVVSSFQPDYDVPLSERNMDGFLDWIAVHRQDATAMVCYNDNTAAWAIEAVKSVGISVPDDLSITGFDNLPISSLTTPALTTIGFDWREIGTESVRVLHRRLSDSQSSVRFIQIGGELILRRSVLDRSAQLTADE